MTYEQAIEYIHGVQWLGSKPGLSRTRDLLARLGDPQKGMKFIHVAGTNGKGSVCAMLERILRENGYNVGLYTSPYVYRFNERIKAGEYISDTELAELVELIKPHADRMHDMPTEFEIITALAFLYYNRKKCDVIVLETGMGGELDSTNVIEDPLLTVITTIGHDHTQYLGDTLERIATAKAGIMKRGCPLIYYGSTPEVNDIIMNRAKRLDVKVTMPNFCDIMVNNENDGSKSMSYGGFYRVKLSLLGEFQRKNAAIVLEAVKMLDELGFETNRERTINALADVVWRGRFEMISQDPPIILDGAHNPEGVEAAVQSIKSMFPGKDIHVLMGVLADKDVAKMLGALLEVAADFVTVTPNNARAMGAEALAEKIGAKATACEDMSCAAQTFVSRIGSEVGLVMGSLYMSAEIRESIMNILGEKNEIGH